MPLGQFTAFVWWMLTKDLDEKDTARALSRLWQPEVGEVVTDPRSPWYSENEGSAFTALKMSMGGSMTPERGSAVKDSGKPSADRRVGPPDDGADFDLEPIPGPGVPQG
jgi:hypothetical protein